eukprot:c13761_g1_i2.p1 GENE.c13761_g1_i2~~c13761_g1_i2.p1  ORF type:complete len:565 (+),score=70.77 c13761_g1_i2:29-1696(+)
MCDSSSCENADECLQVLDCGHSFCSMCLGKLCKLPGTPTATIECPKDRIVTPIGTRGLAGLPKHAFFCLEHQSSSINETPHDSQLYCDVCEREAPAHQATGYCPDCDQLVCESMTPQHDQTHKLVDPKLSLGLRCQVHNKLFVLYDMELNLPVCKECWSLDQGRYSKSVKSAQELQANVEELLNQARAALDSVQRNAQMVDEFKQNTTVDCKQTESSIAEYFAQVRACLAARENSALKEIRKSTKDTGFELHDQQQCLQNVGACVQHAVNTALRARGDVTTLADVTQQLSAAIRQAGTSTGSVTANIDGLKRCIARPKLSDTARAEVCAAIDSLAIVSSIADDSALTLNQVQDAAPDFKLIYHYDLETKQILQDERPSLLVRSIADFSRMEAIRQYIGRTGRVYQIMTQNCEIRYDGHSAPVMFGHFKHFAEESWSTEIDFGTQINLMGTAFDFSHRFTCGQSASAWTCGVTHMARNTVKSCDGYSFVSQSRTQYSGSWPYTCTGGGLSDGLTCLQATGPGNHHSFVVAGPEGFAQSNYVATAHIKEIKIWVRFP